MLRPWADVPSKEKWPPISEDEFIRRCSPGVDRERALKVRRIISEQLGVDYDRVYLSKDLWRISDVIDRKYAGNHAVNRSGEIAF